MGKDHNSSKKGYLGRVPRRDQNKDPLKDTIKDPLKEPSREPVKEPSKDRLKGGGAAAERQSFLEAEAGTWGGIPLGGGSRHGTQADVC